MNEKQQKHEGGCLCGEVRYEITGLPEWAAHCHCRSCQKALGAAFATWAKVKGENFTITKGEIRLCQTQQGGKRGFCGNCGTSLTYDAETEVEGEDWAGDAWFSLITLDDPSIVAPKTHVYVSHRQPWIKMDDGIPTFEQFQIPAIFIRRKPQP